MSQARNDDDALIDAHMHVVPPGLPGLHAFPAVLDGSVETVAAAVRAELAASGTAQALAMGALSADPADPLGVAATLRIADQVPGLYAIGVADPRRNDSMHWDRIERQLQTGRVKGFKVYLGYLHYGPASPGYTPYYRLAARYQIPVIFHSGDTYAAAAKLKYAHPLLIDEVAVDHPDVNFVIAHGGCPWFLDAAEVIYKNANVWADLSGIFVGDEAAFVALAARGRLQRTVERLREALEYAERPDRFLYGTDWPLAPLAAYRAFLAPLLDDPEWRALRADNARVLFRL
ncbi:MAG TPA: amidohydrolase family protein [Candidatus Competibacteraceae bacterium]|nr:amidohydrolase family protein [Candidatus Competibacteraceae bacterium]